MKTLIYKGFLLAALLFIPLGSVVAAAAETGNVYVGRDEIMSGNLYIAGESVTIDGTISGDLIAAARSIRVSGRIEGDIIAAAQEIIIDGDVGGNIRVAGNSLVINGDVARNINAFGTNIVLGPDSRVGWDVYLAGATVEARGVIDGSLGGQAGQVLLAGSVGKSVNLTLDDNRDITPLTLAPTTVVNGDLIYTSAAPAAISSQAAIAGEIKQITPPAKNDGDMTRWVWKELFAIFSALVVGLALIFIGKNVTPKILDKMENEPIKTILPGLILMFLLPPIALVLAFTVIGLPLALISITAWLILIYLGKILSALLIGQIIIAKFSKSRPSHLLWPLIVGVIIAWLLFAIPYVGWFICLIAAWFGLGGIGNYAYREC